VVEANSRKPPASPMMGAASPIKTKQGSNIPDLGMMKN